MNIYAKDGNLYVRDDNATNKEQELTAKIKRLEAKVDEVLKETRTNKEDEELMQRLKAIKGTGIR